jgi:hypothetical protein
MQMSYSECNRLVSSQVADKPLHNSSWGPEARSPFSSSHGNRSGDCCSGFDSCTMRDAQVYNSSLRLKISPLLALLLWVQEGTEGGGGGTLCTTLPSTGTSK